MSVVRVVAYFTDGATIGGAEQILLSSLAELDRGRWRPLLFHPPEPGLAPLLQEAGRLGVALRPIPRLHGRAVLAGLVQVAWALRHERVSVAHAHLNWPLACRYHLMAAAMAGTPAICATEHLYVPIPQDHSLYLQRLICARVDRYIAVSHALARQLRRCLGFPARKIQVVHNGIAIDRYRAPSPTTPAIDLGAAPGQRIILTPARLDEQKGHRYLLDAARAIPEGLFVFAGDGPERGALEAKARRLGLEGRVRFLGYRRDVPALLHACDMVVLPSLYEGLPLVVLEAMAAGKPVVATAVGGTGEAISDAESGLLVPPADAAALARAIRRVLSDADLAARLARAGSVRVQAEFSAQTMSRRVEAIYESILSARAAAADG